MAVGYGTVGAAHVEIEVSVQGVSAVAEVFHDVRHIDLIFDGVVTMVKLDTPQLPQLPSALVIPTSEIVELDTQCSAEVIMFIPAFAPTLALNLLVYTEVDLTLPRVALQMAA